MGDRNLKQWQGSQVVDWLHVKPLREKAEQGISVLVRGKLAERPFKFERSSGTTGQLGQEYQSEKSSQIGLTRMLLTIRTRITSNRIVISCSSKMMNSRLSSIGVGQRLRWALETRNEIRKRRTRKRLETLEGLRSLLDPFSAAERSGLTARSVQAVSRLPEVDDRELVRAMEAVVQTREGATAQHLADDIAIQGDDPLQLWPLLVQLTELDGTQL